MKFNPLDSKFTNKTVVRTVSQIKDIVKEEE